MRTFVVTEESRRVCRWLRLLGYDTLFMAAHPKAALVGKAREDGRIVVTRNRRMGLSARVRIIQLRSTQLDAQLRQLAREAPLTARGARAFSRCDRCNAPLKAAAKATVQDRVPPFVYATQRRFRTCPSCRRVYWTATHYGRIAARLSRLWAREARRA